jgi:hypothetical protein
MALCRSTKNGPGTKHRAVDNCSVDPEMLCYGSQNRNHKVHT